MGDFLSVYYRLVYVSTITDNFIPIAQILLRCCFQRAALLSMYFLSVIALHITFVILYSQRMILSNVVRYQPITPQPWIQIGECSHTVCINVEAVEKWGQKGCLPQSVSNCSNAGPVRRSRTRRVVSVGPIGMLGLPYAPPSSKFTIFISEKLFKISS